MPLDQSSAVVVGAIVGASAGIVGSFLAGWRQSRLERDKWLRAREDSVRADTRNSLASLAKTLAAAAHSMMWSTYKTLNTSECTEEELSRYEAEFHTAVSDMVGMQMHIAALDQSLFERVTPLVSEAISLGGETFVSLKAAVEDTAAAESELSDCNDKALALIKRVPKELANVLRS